MMEGVAAQQPSCGREAIGGRNLDLATMMVCNLASSVSCSEEYNVPSIFFLSKQLVDAHSGVRLAKGKS
jgi:hypothetical protein